MRGQARIEALQAPLGAAPAAVPLMRVFVRELAEGQEVAGAFAVMECEVQARYPAGDRMMYVAEVLAMGHDPSTEPLIHYEKKVYRFLQDPAIG